MFYKEFLSFVLFLLLPLSEGAIPGTFFWRPRLGIDLSIPTTEPPVSAYQPNRANIHAGIVVLIDGYDVLTSLLGLLSGIQYASDDDTMDPTNGLYYTSAYRWALRTLNLFPHWMRGNFHDALAVWQNRFKYMDSEVPYWVRKALPWVPADSWDKEIKNLIKFRKFSEQAFSPFYRFPSKTFRNFMSFIPDEVEAFVFSTVERDVSKITLEDPETKKKRQEALKKELESAPGKKNIINANTTTTAAPVSTPAGK